MLTRCVRAGRDRGSAVPLAVASIGLLVMVSAALAVCNGLVVAHRRAQAAADLAALAGAQAAVAGGEGCQAAAQAAALNRATVEGCVSDGQAVRVTVRVEGPRVASWSAAMRAQVRAGPS